MVIIIETIMFDSAVNRELPPGAAYAAYVDGGIGDQPNYHSVSALFPGANVLSIALHADHDAEALDMEKGAATASQFPGWYLRQRGRGVVRPVGYASADPMASLLLPVLAAAGIPRAAVRLWSAHTGVGPHLCGPRSCGAVPVDVDATQWTWNALGRPLDQSLLREDFFATVPGPVPIPTPPWEAILLQALPVLMSGTTGQPVRTVQGLCVARGHAIAVDGTFGAATAAAVRAVQAAARLPVDGIVGPETWPALLDIL